MEEEKHIGKTTDTLKTLKEIIDWQCYNCGKYFCSPMADNLRAEAVKWVKEIDNFKKSAEDLLWEEFTGKTIEYSKDSIMGLRNWIIHFFNLTEEDLA